MYDDFPREAKSFKFFLVSVTISLVGVVLWLSVAQPMGLGEGAGVAQTQTH